VSEDELKAAVLKLCATYRLRTLHIRPARTADGVT
jgi:hypothetical protein